MNGGAYGGETKDVLVEARGVDRQGNVRTFSNADMGFSYRHCGVPDDVIFTAAVFQGRAGDPEAIAAEMDAIKKKREASQPRNRTGGSTFKNPPGHSAWKLVDDAGCRGLTIGGAQVSELHCNFLINLGGATAADIETLGETVRAAREGAFRRRAGMGNQAGRNAMSAGKRSMKHVAVLMGGWSAEREISLRSGKACADALERSGYQRQPHRRRSRDRRDLRALQAGCRAQRSSRPSGRGRHPAGHARGSRHSLHPFRRARLGAGDEEGHRQERAQGGGGAGARRHGGHAHGGRASVTCCRHLM